MSLAMCCRRSASRLASSVCGRGRSISTVVNRPSLVHNPSTLLRPFVSRGRGFLYSTAAAIDDDWISSEQAVLRVIDSEFNAIVKINKNDLLESFFMSIWNDHSKGRMTLPASFPFKVEDIPGSRSITLTREYNGEHIKVVVSMPIPKDDGSPSFKSSSDDDAPSNESNDDDAPSNESNDHDEDDAPSNESNDEDDASSNESSDDDDDGYTYPLVVNVTKKSGRSLELRCRTSFDEITIDDINVNLPGRSSEDLEVIRDLDDIVGIEHKNLKETFNEYLEIRGLDESTIFSIRRYMSDKMRLEYWLWLDYVKEFLEE